MSRYHGHLYNGIFLWRESQRRFECKIDSLDNRIRIPEDALAELGHAGSDWAVNLDSHTLTTANPHEVEPRSKSSFLSALGWIVASVDVPSLLIAMGFFIDSAQELPGPVSACLRSEGRRQSRRHLPD